MDKATELFRWFISLSPQKGLTAVLLSLVILFGWHSFNTMEMNEALQKERNSSSLDCADKIAKANIANQLKLAEQSEKSQIRYDNYRDRVEKDNLERIAVWKSKYESVQEKLEQTQIKQIQTDEIIKQLTKKLK